MARASLGKAPGSVAARPAESSGVGREFEPRRSTGGGPWRAAWPILEGLGLVGILLVAAQLRLTNVEHYSGSFDEGVRMEQLLLMEHGFRPFRDIFASQGPLLLDLLYPFYLLFGRTLGAARLGVSVLSLAGIVGAWWALRPLHPLAGLGAALLLALSPGYLDNSRLALAEIPSLMPCLFAIGCGLRWQRGGAAGWLYAAALLATLGVLIKPLALPVVAPLALFALLRRPIRPLHVVGAAAAGLALGAVVLLVLEPWRVYEVLGGYRLGAQRPAGSAAAANLVLITKLLGGVERVGFVGLALVGALFGALVWPRPTLALVAWPLAQLGLFALYTDLADKHVVYLVPQLALLGGLAFGGLGVALGQARRERSPAWAAAGLALVVAVGLYAATIPSLWGTNRELLRDGDVRARRDYAGTHEQTRIIASLTGPDEFVLTDHPIAAFEARRLVPPWLVDTSGTRVDAGSLTSEVAIGEASRYQPKVVVTWRRRLGKLDSFMRWLATDYRLVTTYPGSDPSTPLQLWVRADLEDEARAVVGER